MKKFLKYSAFIAVSFAIAAPALAATLVLPTPPPTGNNQAVTGTSIVNIITTLVNYLITVSTVVAVGMFIWGALKYAVLTKPDEGKLIMQNAAWALLAILGVGLLINTIAGLLSRGLQLG